jgi:hypothetical protein
VYDKQARTAFVKGMHNQFAHLNLNALGLHGDATPKDDYFWQAWTYPARQGRLVRAFKNRSWGTGADPWILNVEELTTLWHFPSLLVKAPLVKKAEAKRAEPPVGLPIGSDDDDMYSRVPPRAAAAAHSSGGHGEHRQEDRVPVEPEIHLPTAVAHADSGDEREMGLDATDMGPPADVALPGPPPGWSPDEDGSDAQAPTNLPV